MLTKRIYDQSWCQHQAPIPFTHSVPIPWGRSKRYMKIRYTFWENQLIGKIPTYLKTLQSLYIQSNIDNLFNERGTPSLSYPCMVNKWGLPQDKWFPPDSLYVFCIKIVHIKDSHDVLLILHVQCHQDFWCSSSCTKCSLPDVPYVQAWSGSCATL